MATGSAKSQGELLVGAMPALFAYVRRRVGDLEMAEEIVQEVSLRALAGTAPEDPKSFLLWSCGIARHVIYGEWRRLRRIRSEQPSDDLVIGGVHDPRPQPDRVLDARASLARAICDDEETFALLLRRYVDRESSKALAAELGLTTAALRMRLMRIRASSRARLVPA
jgi:DNA-directed RNA polymerase specialized sigma24 family protein